MPDGNGCGSGQVIADVKSGSPGTVGSLTQSGSAGTPRPAQRTWAAILLLSSAVAILLLGCVTVSRSKVLDTTPPPEFAPGISYTNYRCAFPLSVHVVRVNRTQPGVQFHSVQARRDGLTTNTLSRLIGLMNPELGRPIVAINGDFFQMEKEFAGDPRGLQIIDGELISAPSGGVCLCFDTEGQPFLTNVWSQFTITWPNGFVSAFGLNQDRRSNSWAVLYTPVVGYSTRTRGGRELLLEPFGGTPWLPLQVGFTYTARIREIREGGDACFEPGVMILSLKPDKRHLYPSTSPGDILTISTKTNPDLHGVQTAIGGGPLMVRNGQPQPMTKPFTRPLPSPYSAMVQRNPRSAFGWNDQFFFLVEVDGRQHTLSRGMTIEDLAHYMIQLGCTDAVNLDGGGSSTLWCNGRIVNSPSDKKERQVANALILVRKGGRPLMYRTALAGAIDEVKTNAATNQSPAKPKTNQVVSGKPSGSISNQSPSNSLPKPGN